MKITHSEMLTNRERKESMRGNAMTDPHQKTAVASVIPLASCHREDPVCRALMEDRERLSTLLNAMPDIVCFKDGQGRWLEANDADLRLFGLLEVNYRGKTDAELADLGRPFYRNAFLACERSDEEAWAARRPLQVIETIPVPQGASQVFSLTKIPLFHPDGSRKGLVVLGRNVTEEQGAQERLRHSEEMLNQAQRISNIGHFEWDMANNVLHLSTNAYRIFCLDPGREVNTRTVLNLILPSQRRETLKTFTRALARREDIRYEFTVRLPDGEERLFRAHGTFYCNRHGAATSFLGVVQDVTLLKRSNDLVALLARVFEAAAEGISITDAHGTILQVNQAFTAITGYSAAEAVGSNPRLLKSGYHDEAFYRSLWYDLQHQGQWRGEIWNRRKNGEVYPEWLNITAVRDAENRPINYVAVFSDQTEIRRKEEIIRFARYHDALTNLPNRTLLRDLLSAAIAQTTDHASSIAVLYLDIDNFKRINDSLGYQAGDRLIQEAAARLASCLRPEEVIARMGGDEFCLFFICEDDDSSLLHKMQSLQDTLATPFHISQQPIHLTASFGTALYPRDGHDADILLRRAEMAMSQAKQQGKNVYRFFTKELDDRFRHRLKLENTLRQAIEQGDIVPWYQPRICLHHGRMISAEALARWPQLDGSMVMPNHFIPVAEETGLIIPLGTLMLEQVCQQVRHWQETGHELAVSVNLSPRQFRDRDFLASFQRLLLSTGVDPRLLELEITEQAVIEHEDSAMRTLAALKEMGIRISLDDFGTGYSSLYYLKKLPIDVVKIDRSFVSELPHSRDCTGIVGAILAMSRSLEILSLAEGVESIEQLDFLHRHGCDEAQGYLFSRPQTAQVITEELQREGSSASVGLRGGWQPPELRRPEP
ncbi:MAG: hypothetical protein BWK76_16715 [Desulfobulbaceae bacterium A2]|nr:MAG: hypothetical protein BWK76_16715 [Desulfobulbaceae bacterium A2]